jgi:hypothetical protein
MGAHTCHAMRCSANVPPRMLMCARHWRQVPRRLQAALWAAYVPGQERRMIPTVAYLHAAADCVRAVAAKEGYPAVEVEDDPSVAGYVAWAEMLADEA